MAICGLVSPSVWVCLVCVQFVQLSFTTETVKDMNETRNTTATAVVVEANKHKNVWGSGQPPEKDSTRAKESELAWLGAAN